jgi:hypothetical protein
VAFGEVLSYGLTTFASAAAGVAAERTLNLSGRLFEPAWYYTGGRLLRRRRREIESQLRLSVSSVFTVGPGSHDLFVLEFAQQGLHPDHLVIEPTDTSDLSTVWSRLPPTLRPTSLEDLLLGIEEERRVIETRPGTWNARRYALRRATVTRVGDEEKPAVHLTFGESDYATHRVVSQAWAGLYRSGIASELDEPALRSVVAGLSHSFGVNLTIETADDSLILTRRSDLTSQAHGLRHISVNEGMSLEDQDLNGYPDPYATAIRGVREELGVDLTAHRDKVVFHALILDVTRYEWALLGHVDLRGTDFTDGVFRMQRGIGMSSDDWESDELTLRPWNIESALDLLVSDDDWVGHGYLNLLLSAIHRFPRRREKLIAQAQRALS